MKNLSIILGTLAFLLVAGLSARYFTGFWLFYTFASFQIQGAALAFLIALAALVLFRNWIAGLLALVAIALGAHGFFMLGDFRQDPPLDSKAKPLFRMISINIMGDNSFANGGKIADFLIASGADVIMVQESAPLGPHIGRIKIAYPYRLGCGAQTITCDQSLWSKRPFVKGEVKTASPIYRDRLMLASIDFEGTVVHFANVHLTKPYFDSMHAIELKRVTHFVNLTTGPMVLAGDFNASILTPDVQHFLRQTKLMTAESEPNTWPVAAVPLGTAIDHVFVRDPLRFLSLERLPQTFGSNHYGLTADVTWQDNTATYE